MKMEASRNWVGTMRASITCKTLRAEVRRLGGTVEDDSGGRWHVLQLTAPVGMLWAGEKLRQIRVEWPYGESSEGACREAWQRIYRGDFVPIPEGSRNLYATD